jgi:serine/threonine protein kinase
MASVHLGSLLGEGGFTRLVAIKRLHEQYALDPEFAAMFLDEARLAARIRHPNVVPTLDVYSEEDELFLVMDYVEGASLGQVLRQARAGKQPAPVSIAVAIVSGVLHGLHAAHETKGEDGRPLGVVHRDVSPQNVLVGVDGVARVVDFGVAKAVGRLQTTREGQVKGKSAYMAPEQLRCREVDRRTDIYSAGVVLWETLTAERLFSADTEIGTMALVLEKSVDAPSSRAAGVSPALDDVVMKALQRDPASRFESADAMAEALERAVHPATARDVGLWLRELLGPALARSAELVANAGLASPRPPEAEVPAEIDAALTSISQRTSVPVSAARPVADLQRARPAWRTIAGATVAVALTVVLFLVVGSRGRMSGAPTTIQQAQPSETTSEAVPPPVPPASPGGDKLAVEPSGEGPSPKQPSTRTQPLASPVHRLRRAGPSPRQTGSASTPRAPTPPTGDSLYSRE